MEKLDEKFEKTFLDLDKYGSVSENFPAGE
jgi:hypothetical protein